MAESNLREIFSGGHFLIQQLRQFAAESAERSPDVPQSPPENCVGGSPADPGGVRAYLRESAAEELPPTEKPSFELKLQICCIVVGKMVLT